MISLTRPLRACIFAMSLSLGKSHEMWLRFFWFTFSERVNVFSAAGTLPPIEGCLSWVLVEPSSEGKRWSFSGIGMIAPN